MAREIIIIIIIINYYYIVGGTLSWSRIGNNYPRRPARGRQSLSNNCARNRWRIVVSPRQKVLWTFFLENFL
jgi:hypothetical protein